MKSGLEHLREAILAHGKDFTASQFAHIYKNVRAGISTLVVNGEVEVVYKGDRNNGIPRVYRIANMRTVKIRKAEKEAKPSGVDAWKEVYPDMFRVPDFTGRMAPVRRHNLMDRQEETCTTQD